MYSVSEKIVIIAVLICKKKGGGTLRLCPTISKYFNGLVFIFKKRCLYCVPVCTAIKITRNKPMFYCALFILTESFRVALIFLIITFRMLCICRLIVFFLFIARFSL
jgi:hypothetical protein